MRIIMNGREKNVPKAQAKALVALRKAVLVVEDDVPQPHIPTHDGGIPNDKDPPIVIDGTSEDGRDADEKSETEEAPPVGSAGDAGAPQKPVDELTSGVAGAADSAPGTPAPTVAPKAVKPEKDAGKAAAAPKATKRAYKRRDLRAEG